MENDALKTICALAARCHALKATNREMILATRSFITHVRAKKLPKLSLLIELRSLFPNFCEPLASYLQLASRQDLIRIAVTASHIETASYKAELDRLRASIQKYREENK